MKVTYSSYFYCFKLHTIFFCVYTYIINESDLLPIILIIHYIYISVNIYYLYEGSCENKDADKVFCI